MGLPKRTNLHAQENLYRPVYEYNSSCILLIGAILMFIQSYTVDGSNIAPIILIICTCMVILSLYRINQARPYFRAHWRIFHRVMLYISLDDLRKINNAHLFSDEKVFKQASKDAEENGKQLPIRQTYLCEGYEYGAEHTERTYQVHNLSSNLREIHLPFLLKPITRHFDKLARELGGSYAVFGVDERKPILTTEDNWFGHTFIDGNVGTGKTVLLRLFSNSMLHLGHVVIVIDPKNDQDWQVGLKNECEALGKPFYHFHPAKPSKSVAIDVCHNYVKDSDLASRIMSVIASGDSSDPFLRYGEGLVLNVITGSKLAGEKPTIKSIYRHIQSKDALVRLAVDAFNGYFKKLYGEQDWIARVGVDQKQSHIDRLKQYKEFYLKNFVDNPDSDQKHQNDILPQLLQLAEADYEHFQKMTASLMPLFKQLTGSPLDELISPSEDEKTQRQLVNSEGMFNTGGVLYLSLDGMSDPNTARAISQLITADLTACAGMRYNNASNISELSRISIFIDEAHSAISDAMINMLAQGRAAKIALFVCTQTISDFIASADEATANRISGLCNNFISLRVNDPQTQDLVISNFGKSSIGTNQITYTTSTGTTTAHTDFKGAISERKATTREDAIPKEQLGMMPKLHIIARLADGRKVVGQIAIPIPAPEMKPNTSLLSLVFSSKRKVTFRQNVNVSRIMTYLKRAA